MRRVALPALVAVAIAVCAAASAWLFLSRGVVSAMSAQAHAAGELLDAHVPAGEALARSLLRPGLHVLIADSDAQTVTDAGNDGVITRPFPPGGFVAPGAAGFEAPGPAGALPPGAGNPQPPGVPGAGPGPAPIDRLARSLVAASPIRVVRGNVTIVIEPAVREIANWLRQILAAAVAGVLAIAAIAAIRAAAIGRADRRALEARVSERREAAERYQRFLAETGHELRTPLTVLTGYVDILRGRTGNTPLDERILDGMHAETARMRVLVEKMLTLARLETHVAVPRLLDVASAAADAANLVRHRYPERDVALHPVRTASIVIDADDYAAALGNVLENAIKFAPDSPILIETTVEDGRALTSVEDRGPGIPASDREAIFDRFYRGRGRELGEGVGLGLAIVKRIAERWHGTATCESGDGRTVFRLAFPVADEENYGVAR